MRRVDIKLLKDGSGRVCIHWFVWDKQGKIQQPRGAVRTSLGLVPLGGSALTGERRGRIACQPERTSVLPEMRSGIICLFCHSDDPRAVTCPACQATPEYKKIMEEMKEKLDTATVVA